MLSSMLDDAQGLGFARLGAGSWSFGPTLLDGPQPLLSNLYTYARSRRHDSRPGDSHHLDDSLA